MFVVFSENTVYKTFSDDSKNWKYLFKTDGYRNVKQEQLECHLYGQLISILLCSSTMFKMRKLLLRKKQKELIDNANPNYRQREKNVYYSPPSVY